MDLINGNWIWGIIAVAVLWFFIRRGGFHGHGLGGHHGRSHGGHHHRDDYGGASRPADAEVTGGAEGAALDPVSGNPVRTDRALTAVFAGRAYYFESDETRKRFEAEPQKYAHAAAPAPQAERPRRRHGC